MSLKENVPTQDPKAVGNQSILVKYWYVEMTGKRCPFERIDVFYTGTYRYQGLQIVPLCHYWV